MGDPSQCNRQGKEKEFIKLRKEEIKFLLFKNYMTEQVENPKESINYKINK